jgi:hypothetical protein
VSYLDDVAHSGNDPGVLVRIDLHVGLDDVGRLGDGRGQHSGQQSRGKGDRGHHVWSLPLCKRGGGDEGGGRDGMEEGVERDTAGNETGLHRQANH